jgi:hypothetical protein
MERVRWAERGEAQHCQTTTLGFALLSPTYGAAAFGQTPSMGLHRTQRLRHPLA